MRIITSFKKQKDFVIIMAAVFAPLSIVTGMWPVAVILIAVSIIMYRIYDRLFIINKRHILFLRNFNDEQSNKIYYEIISPILNCFGPPVTVAYKYNFSFETLDRWVNFLRNSQKTMGYIELNNSNWKNEITDLIRKVQLVVIDLSQPTQNVLWELDTSVRIKGYSKIIMISDRNCNLYEEIDFTKFNVISPLTHDLKKELASMLKKLLGTPKGLKRFQLNNILRSGSESLHNILGAFDILIKAAIGRY